MAEKVHAVGTIIENEKGEILLLKRHKNDPEGETWGLVGGKIDDGENGITAAIREINEEIGIHLSANQLVFIKGFHWDRADLDIYFDVFKTSLISQSSEFKLPENEITEYLWIFPNDAKKRPDLMQGLYHILEETHHD
jgi:8-oxo-dGTP diphosphatase